MTLRLLYMPAQIIQTMTFTQIMVIWTPWTTPYRTTLTRQFSKWGIKPVSCQGAFLLLSCLFTQMLWFSSRQGSIDMKDKKWIKCMWDLRGHMTLIKKHNVIAPDVYIILLFTISSSSQKKCPSWNLLTIHDLGMVRKLYLVCSQPKDAYTIKLE